MSESPTEGPERKRPTPVREALEKSGAERQEERHTPTPVRSLEPPQPARVPAGGAPAPAPVSDAAPEAERGPAPAREALEPPPPLAAETQPQAAFRSGEQEWVARIEGHGSSGTHPDLGAPLLALTFAAAGEPGRPLLEVLCVGRTLAAFSEEELAALLQRARPFRGRGERPEIFSDTRLRKKEL